MKGKFSYESVSINICDMAVLLHFKHIHREKKHKYDNGVWIEKLVIVLNDNLYILQNALDIMGLYYIYFHFA